MTEYSAISRPILWVLLATEHGSSLHLFDLLQHLFQFSELVTHYLALFSDHIFNKTVLNLVASCLRYHFRTNFVELCTEFLFHLSHNLLVSLLNFLDASSPLFFFKFEVIRRLYHEDVHIFIFFFSVLRKSRMVYPKKP